MSAKRFFNINNSIFNRDHVVAIHQQTVKVEVTKNVAVVRVMEGGESVDHMVYLPEGKNVSDFIGANELNSLD